MSPQLSSRVPKPGVVLFAVLVVMALHESEHVAQVIQKNALSRSCPNECGGFLGFALDTEWIHLAYNHSILLLLAAVYVLFRMWRREWRARLVPWAALTAGVFLVQGYHVVEHSFKLEQWFANGRREGTPGLLGHFVAPAEGRAFSLVELHFLLNTIVFVLVVAGYVGLRLHRDLTSLRRPARALAVAAPVVAFGGIVGVALAYQPPTVRLAAGVHDGPIVVTRAQRLVGEPGAVVRGGIVVRASDVVVRDLAVVGGNHGIVVDGATGVVLDRVRVSRARLDGIHVRRSSVSIRNCRIDGVGNRWAQGVDVSFSFDLPPSTVKGCTIVGGYEGIVSNSARVAVRENRVSKTSLRGIAVNEMSMGVVERNDVRDSLGVGIFCGDYSKCDIGHNTVADTRPDRSSGDLTRMGYGIQAHFGATATLEENEVVRSPGGIGSFFRAQISRG